MKVHRVETIHFFVGRNEGQITCLCGWVGLVSGWEKHGGKMFMVDKPPGAPRKDVCKRGHDDWVPMKGGGRRCGTCPGILKEAAQQAMVAA